MILSLLLPWFPILLGVGVGGRLLGRTRGLFLGILGALFWVVLLQASVGYGVWRDPWTVATLIAGAVTIAAMGAWSGETHVDCRLAVGDCRSDEPGASAANRRSTVDNRRSGEHQETFRELAAAAEQFDDWLDEHREDVDPWPRFDEFIRSTLYRCCRATHVRPYRLLCEGEELAALREPDGPVESERLPARRGIIGHVVTTGRSYLAGDPMQGELVDKLAGASQDPQGASGAEVLCPGVAPIAWCFPIREGTHRLGAITVGQLGIPPHDHVALLRLVEKMINQFWVTLFEVVRSRLAVQDDPVSGLPTRPAFLRLAEQSLAESYRQGEPVAVAVLTLEGLRELSDSGRWETADELVQQVSGELRRKVRMDDRLGRFDGSAFIVLLRRVDSELASLIVSQLMSRVAALCGNEERWRATVAVRCGLAGSGTGKPTLTALVSRALAQCRRARLENTPIAADLGPTNSVGAPGRNPSHAGMTS